MKGGLYGEGPNLSKLDTSGNIPYAVDFRSVYQEILDRHLVVDSREIFNESYERVPFIHAS